MVLGFGNSLEKKTHRPVTVTGPDMIPPSPPRGHFDVSKYKYHINISLNEVLRRTEDER